MVIEPGRTATEMVGAAVAEKESVDPIDLPRLDEAIDTEAFDSLVSDRVLLIEFDWFGYTVSFDKDRDVRLHQMEQR